MRLKDKVVIITGASRGIGRAAALKFAEEGAKLTLVDIDEQGLKDTLERVQKQVSGAQAIIVKADVSQEEQVQNYVNATVEAFSRIDGFLNNAGTEGQAAPTADHDTQQFDKVIAINLRGVFLGLKYVLKVMQSQGSGSIVNTSSIGGIGALENSCAYVASKHGVIGLSRNAAVEYGKYGIRVNALCPGFIDTELFRNVAAKMSPHNPQAFYDTVESGIPSGRVGKPEEIANLAAFLLSDEASYLNGSVQVTDGAFTAR